MAPGSIPGGHLEASLPSKPHSSADQAPGRGDWRRVGFSGAAALLLDPGGPAAVLPGAATPRRADSDTAALALWAAGLQLASRRRAC